MITKVSNYLHICRGLLVFHRGADIAYFIWLWSLSQAAPYLTRPFVFWRWAESAWLAIGSHFGGSLYRNKNIHISLIYFWSNALSNRSHSKSLFIVEVPLNWTFEMDAAPSQHDIRSTFYSSGSTSAPCIFPKMQYCIWFIYINEQLWNFGGLIPTFLSKLTIKSDNKKN